MKQACDNMTVDVPDVMIQEKAEEIVRNYAAQFGLSDRKVSFEELLRMMGLDAATMNQTILPSAEFQVRTDLLLEAVAKAEGFEFTEEETEAYIKKIAESVNAKPEDIKTYFGAEMIAAEQSKERANAVIFDSAIALDPEETASEEPAAEE